MFYLSLVGATLSISGIILLFFVSWKIVLGLFLIVWGEAIHNRVKEIYNNRNFHDNIENTWKEE